MPCGHESGVTFAGCVFCKLEEVKRERDKWREAAGQQMVRAEGLEDLLEKAGRRPQEDNERTD